MRQPELSGDFARLMEWADAARRMEVRANAETPADARAARTFGAEGIGLCRTEHMFFDEDRIVAMREMILADSEDGRRDGARQAPADAARRLRRALRDHARPAGDDPPARSAAARVPAEERGGDRRGGGGDGGRAGASCASARMPCTSSTRCSAIAAAASASPTRRSPRCRRARSSRRRPRSASEDGEAVDARRSWCRWSWPRPSSTWSRR